eukprot:COSAG01_NODE_9429_length_2448_cov_1.419327_1_plen_184_part_00
MLSVISCANSALRLQMQAEQQSHDQVKNQFQFKPRLNHGSKAIAGRLMLNTKDGRETYLNRIKVLEYLSCACGQEHMKRRGLQLPSNTVWGTGTQEADEDLNQAIAEHRARQHDKELSECTFKPEVRTTRTYASCSRSLTCTRQIRDAPQYVKRIASSMKLNKATKPAQSKTTYSFLSAVSHD